MTVETANFINQLNVALPANLDVAREGDDHFRLIKTVLKNSFPNIGGAMTLTHTQLNALLGLAVPPNPQQGAVSVTPGQTLITVPFTYVPTSKRLLVWLGGLKLIQGTHYTETDATKITLSTPAAASAIAEFLELVP